MPLRNRKKSVSVAVTILLFFSSCRYRFEDQICEERNVTLTIPYVFGDTDGMLTDALVRQATASGIFTCVQNGGEYRLNVEIISDTNSRIGYRYDRNPQTGAIKKNLIPVEYRRTVLAEVTLVKSSTEEILFGPTAISADGEFDAILPSVLDDLTFITPEGFREKTIQFSLGQLDSMEGGMDNVRVPLFRQLAEAIMDGAIHHL